MDEDNHFTPFIHNYCDRWCERCDFTNRCRVFAMEAEMSVETKDVGSDAFVRSLTNILEDAQKILVEKAEEFGIDFDTAIDPEIVESRKRKRQTVRSEELARFADAYAFDAQPVLESKNEWLGEAEDDDLSVGQMLEILYWYQFFIAAKVQRGLGGILDFDGDEDWDELHDTQSDANGSIKIALIAIERSILAWTYLLSPKNAEVIRPQIELLEKIKSIAETKFPNAGDFVRPGFDEIEMVM